MSNIYIIDGGDAIKETLIGVIAGMLYGANVVKQDKPVLGVALDDEGVLKISSRGNWGLIRKGLVLGKVMKEAARSVGGDGGGHNIAAGATIDPSKKREFLEKANEIVKEQLAK